MPSGVDPSVKRHARQQTSAAPSLLVLPPSAAFAADVACYWSGRGAVGAQYLQVPDGCVDIVLRWSGDDIRADAYGTSTSATRGALHANAHYLGIRLQPGRARHLLHVAASELTDACAPLHEVSVLAVPSRLQGLGRKYWTAPDQRVVADASDGGSSRAIPAGQIRGRAPGGHVGMSGSSSAQPPTIPAVASVACLGRRQFERCFHEQVGVSPHRFIAIARFQRACALPARPGDFIADICPCLRVRRPQPPGPCVPVNGGDDPDPVVTGCRNHPRPRRPLSRHWRLHDHWSMQ